MPAIDFPAAPAVNDEYSFEGRTWRWNGTGWEVKEYPAALLAGTAANPSLYFSGDPNTGLYSPGADQVAISTGGTGRFFVDVSGNVGVGTSGPNVLLHLDSAPAGTGSAGVIGFGDVGNYRFAEIEGYREGGSFAGSLIFRTQTFGGISPAGSERLRIDSTGNVGIGTSSPSTLLHVDTVSNATAITVAASTATSGQLRLGTGGVTSNNQSILSTGNGLDIGTTLASAITFCTNGIANERARIDSTGRLLVGTSSARSNFFNGALSAALQLEGTDNARRMSITGNDANPVFVLAREKSGSVGGNTIVANNDILGAISFQGSDGTEFVSGVEIIAVVDGTPGANDLPSRLVFSTTADGASSPTEAMRINNQRELLIGTTTRTANGGVLQISNGITFPGTQSACSDANTLDDYEEGTWTVGFFDASSAGNQSATTGTGTYTKVGRLVTCNFEVDNVSTSGLATTTNPLYFSLPFTPLSTGPASTNGVSTLINVAGSTSYVRATVFNYLSRGAFYLNSTTLAYPAVRVSDVTSASNRIGASFFYYV